MAVNGIPKGYTLYQRNDDGRYFLSKAATNSQPYQQTVLVPVHIGYHAQGRTYSLEDVPADAPARELSVIA
jgi:hypothetical protein